MKLLNELVATIIEEARVREDLECCGIILASPDAPEVGCWLYPARNRAKTSKISEFVLDSTTHLRVVELEARGQVVIVGYYHSHPSSSPEPSSVDVERTPPGVIYVIAGREGGDWGLRAWRKKEGGFDEEPIELEMNKWLALL
jgi:proteasome lid subunit RPN8/RPN11